MTKGKKFLIATSLISGAILAAIMPSYLANDHYYHDRYEYCRHVMGIQITQGLGWHGETDGPKCRAEYDYLHTN